MNRRNFFRGFLGAAVAMVMAPFVKSDEVKSYTHQIWLKNRQSGVSLSIKPLDKSEWIPLGEVKDLKIDYSKTRQLGWSRIHQAYQEDQINGKFIIHPEQRKALIELFDTEKDND